MERIQDWEARARAAGHRPAALARLVGVSVRQLERVFRQRHGCTPHEWLVGTRLRHATELLRQGQCNKHVAAEVGFRSESSLCRFFQQVTGATPQAYVAACSRRVAPFASRLSSANIRAARATDDFAI